MTANKAGIASPSTTALIWPRRSTRASSNSPLSKSVGEADELSLTLHNHDGQLKAPETGRYIRLALGWESGDDVTIGLVDKGRFASTKWKKADHPTRSRSAPARPTSPAPAASDG
jgi:phage protein D